MRINPMHLIDQPAPKADRAHAPSLRLIERLQQGARVFDFSRGRSECAVAGLDLTGMNTAFAAKPQAVRLGGIRHEASEIGDIRIGAIECIDACLGGRQHDLGAHRAQVLNGGRHAGSGPQIAHAELHRNHPGTGPAQLGCVPDATR